MPLAVKIGQMILAGFRGLEVNENHHIIKDIKERHLGGVVLFDYDVPSRSPVRNISSSKQVQTLISTLQAAAAFPLLVSIDQEGGRIQRLKEKFGFPPSLSHYHLGTKNDLALTRNSAGTIAKTLNQLGFNLNFAPVVDLNTNPANPIIGKLERSFSHEPDIVSAHALEYIRAHHSYGVLTTLKHFPGHGSSTGDSHLGLVDVTESWSREELLPYKKIIQSGEIDAAMTAHVFNSHLDPEYPATLSKLIITGILRNELNFDGVVISDDMQMKAIRSHYGFETAIQKAVEAGIDIITIGNNAVYDEDVVKKAVTYLTQLVDKGIISEVRIDESYRRIMKLKAKCIPTD